MASLSKRDARDKAGRGELVPLYALAPEVAEAGRDGTAPYRAVPLSRCPGETAPFVLGIDPGKSGALALLDVAAATVEIEDVPILRVRGKVVVDHYGLARVVDAWAPLNPLVVIEQVGSRPGEGHAGAFDFGRTCGLILGVCAAHFLRAEYVTPAKWKAAMKVRGDKDESRQRAATLFPRQSGLFARVKDDGRADAALIAAWGAQFLERA